MPAIRTGVAAVWREHASMPRASSHLLPSASLRTCAYVQGLLHEVGTVAIGLLIKPLWLKHGALLRTEAAAVCKRWIIMMPATSRSGTVTNDSERSAAPTSMFLDWYQACRGKQATTQIGLGG